MEAIPENEVALLLILAGPAGSGKTTLCDRLVDENGHLERVVTCTTRAPREGEIDGVDYYFFSDDQFDAKVEDEEFLEWAHVHTYRYGTLKSTIEAKLEDDVDLVMNIDVQGVASVQEAARNQPMIGQRLVTVFIMPASFDELKGASGEEARMTKWRSLVESSPPKRKSSNGDPSITFCVPSRKPKIFRRSQAFGRPKNGGLLDTCKWQRGRDWPSIS